MTDARIFISYRTSDGADKATALARDLGQVFGDAQVFLDKEDLPAGRPWREAIGDALDHRPVLLVLVTPDTFGGRDAQGALHIADVHDPVRRELGEALNAGAQVIPLLADGVDKLPEGLPPPLDGLPERTWRRLRAYDWRNDFERLVGDLEAAGVVRLVPLQDRRRTDRLRRGALAAAALLAVGAGATWWWFGPHADQLARDVTGGWTAQVAPPVNEAGSRLDRVRLHLAQEKSGAVKLISQPIDITQDPAWRGFAAGWLQRFDQRLERVVWRGQGTARVETGQPLRLDIALSVETEAGGTSIEGGNLSLASDGSGRRLTGRLWMNGEQAERPIELQRGGARP